MGLNTELQGQLLGYQRNEITEYHIYRRLASAQKSPENRDVLEKIAQDQLGHYQLWKEHTQRDVQPRQSSIITFQSPRTPPSNAGSWKWRLSAWEWRGSALSWAT